MTSERTATQVNGDAGDAAPGDQGRPDRYDTINATDESTQINGNINLAALEVLSRRNGGRA